MIEEIAEKYPKAWELYEKWYCYEKYDYPKNAGHKIYISVPLQFLQHFGYFILEFFPKHGIEIERRITLSEWSGGKIIFNYNILFDEMYKFRAIKTYREAIEKAFEILNERLPS